VPPMQRRQKHAVTTETLTATARHAHTRPSKTEKADTPADKARARRGCIPRLQHRLFMRNFVALLLQAIALCSAALARQITL